LLDDVELPSASVTVVVKPLDAVVVVAPSGAVTVIVRAVGFMVVVLNKFGEAPS
jgi:hypothetical protein